MGRLADELLPALIARLEASAPRASWRSAATAGASACAGPPGRRPDRRHGPRGPGARAPRPTRRPPPVGARHSRRSARGLPSRSADRRPAAVSPAVGYFSPLGSLSAGVAVRSRRRARPRRRARRAPGGRRPADGVVGRYLAEVGRGRGVRPGARPPRGRPRRIRGQRPRRGRLMFERILIANRGEIALRILRTCRRLGIGAVVAYSEADRDTRAVQLADEAICVGPAEATRELPVGAGASSRRRIVTGCDAIHPGYGFLSEDDTFAEMTRAHGLTFIGPPAEVLERFASKAGTRTCWRATACPPMPGLGRDAARRRARPGGGRADRLPGADQAVRRRRRQGHAHGALAARARSRPSPSAARRPGPPSATTRCTWRSGWRTTATWRSR